MAAGFTTPNDVLEAKPTQVHQRLNGFRKKNKLDLAALSLEEVSAWYAGADNSCVMSETATLPSEQDVIDIVKTIFDPEIPVDIYELGLIYEINVKESGFIHIDMTLTSPNCPVAESLPQDVENKVASLDGAKGCKVTIVFEPAWTQDMMSEEAKLELGFL